MAFPISHLDATCAGCQHSILLLHAPPGAAPCLRWLIGPLDGRRTRAESPSRVFMVWWAHGFGGWTTGTSPFSCPGIFIHLNFHLGSTVVGWDNGLHLLAITGLAPSACGFRLGERGGRAPKLVCCVLYGCMYARACVYALLYTWPRAL